MRFMLLLKSDEQAEAGVLPDEQIIAAMGKYNDDMARAGVLLAGEGLHPSAKGARLRASKGKLTVTDGPFAETKELLAGYWQIEVNSKEEAVEWAKRCPFEADSASAASGAVGQIEVRQVFELSDFPVNEAESGWREREAAMRAESQAAHPVETVRPSSAAPAGRTPMRFMMMFKADQDSEAGVLPDESLLTEMGDLMAEMAQAGALLSGEGLQASAKGARVTFTRGRRTVTDGPFTETKELIAGYSLIRVNSKEEAIEWARRGILIDAAGRGGESNVEIRQVFEVSDFPPDLLAKVPEAFDSQR